MAFLWDLGFLVLWWLVSKARVPREWESHVDTKSLLLTYFELTHCHFCHILSVKAVTESRPDSTRGGKVNFPACGGVRRSWKSSSIAVDILENKLCPVTYSNILLMLIPFQCEDLWYYGKTQMKSRDGRKGKWGMYEKGRKKRKTFMLGRGFTFMTVLSR